MNVRKVSAQSAKSILKLKKCRPTTLPHGARAARQRQKTVKCFALTATAARAIHNLCLSLTFCYRLVSHCRFKRQISNKTQYTVSGYPEKPQHIEQYAKNSPVFGVEIKYRAVSIYSFSESSPTLKESDKLF